MGFQSDNSKKNPAVWINPTGGMGDVLMLSGVLKQCFDEDPGTRFNLVRRSIYTSILRDHPAIAQIGYPPKDAKVITTDYWAKEKLGKGGGRAYQILARMFGLKTPVKEHLFLPGSVPEDNILQRMIPGSGKMKVAIAPVSASPRKMIPAHKWEKLVELLMENDIEVVQLGGSDDLPIPGAFSLLGLTTPQQLIGILKNCTLLIGVDNFLMHAAQLVETKCLIIWGPTDPEIYGYSEDMHIVNSTAHCRLRDQCLGPDTPDNYSKPCPMNEEHCMNLKTPEELFKSSMEFIRF